MIHEYEIWTCELVNSVYFFQNPKATYFTLLNFPLMKF